MSTARPGNAPQHGYPERSLLPASTAGTSNTGVWPAGFSVGVFEAGSFEAALSTEQAGLAMILQGRTQACITIGQRQWDFCPGPDSVGLFAPRVDIAWSRWTCEPGAVRMALRLDLDEMQRFGDLDLIQPARRKLRLDPALSDPTLAALMRLIGTEALAGAPHGRLYGSSLCMSLAAYLCQTHADGGTARPRERGRLSRAQQTQVQDLILQRLGSDLGVEELAQAAGVSRFHFARLFRNTHGCSPYHHLLLQRLDAAGELLRSTERSLSDVALATGFSSQSHLSSTMRRVRGVTPGDLRRSQAGRTFKAPR